ncbi:MAG TPA: hypothetical protein VNC17_01200 [Thermoleophilaceae bacterium]|nr:hypothetical protein [Thermoleophilaceae bacterium]
MQKRYVVLALALTVALCAALPAVGASPAQLATKAFGLAKKANKRAKSADKRARSAQSAAGAAANGAQATADSARSAASSAQAAAGAAQSAAGAARTSARQGYRDGGQALAPAAGPITVATMSGVAPGAYTIMAKTDVFAGGAGSGIVQCRVSAGGDSDFANTLLGSGTGDFEDTLQANTVHTFTATGAILFQCTNQGPIGTSPTAQETKIIANKVGEITSNTAVSG